MTPFDFSTAILTTKENLLLENDDKEYVPYIVNRVLSYYPDAIYHANQMNMAHQLPKNMQFHYLLAVIKGKKRQYSKWPKPDNVEDIKLLQEVYGYNNEKAKTALKMLSEEQMKAIRATRVKGGTK